MTNREHSTASSIPSRVSEIFLPRSGESEPERRDALALAFGGGARELYELGLHFDNEPIPSPLVHDRAVIEGRIEQWYHERLELIDQVARRIHTTTPDRTLLECAAMAVAEFAHMGQERKVGDDQPYTIHTSAVANGLRESVQDDNPGMMQATLVVAHLHDGVETLLAEMRATKTDSNASNTHEHPQLRSWRPVSPLTSRRLWVTTRMISELYQTYASDSSQADMVTQSVVLLTKRYDFTKAIAERYGEPTYIRAIAADEVATRVKLADTVNNLSNLDDMPISPKKKRHKRREYSQNMRILTSKGSICETEAHAIIEAVQGIDLSHEARQARIRRSIAQQAIAGVQLVEMV